MQNTPVPGPGGPRASAHGATRAAIRQARGTRAAQRPASGGRRLYGLDSSCGADRWAQTHAVLERVANSRWFDQGMPVGTRPSRFSRLRVEPVRIRRATGTAELPRGAAGGCLRPKAALLRSAAARQVRPRATCPESSSLRSQRSVELKRVGTMQAPGASSGRFRPPRASVDPGSRSVRANPGSRSSDRRARRGRECAGV